MAKYRAIFRFFLLVRIKSWTRSRFLLLMAGDQHLGLFPNTATIPSRHRSYSIDENGTQLA